MDRHEDDPGGRVLAQDRGRGRDPVEARHRDVADNHVRRQPLGGADERETVPHLRDHVELRLEQTAQQFRGFRVIVGEQQTWVSHGLSVWNGLSLWMGGVGAERKRTESAAGKTTGLAPKNY